MKRSTWLDACEHPSANDLFSLPNGIFFLIKFRQDLKAFGYQSLDERVTVYCWWMASGYKEYPDFCWTLRSQDYEYLHNINLDDFLQLHQTGLEWWLRGKTRSLLDEKEGLIEILFEPTLLDSSCLMPIPRFLLLIFQARLELQAAFDLSTFVGGLGLLTWWDEHGQPLYTRIQWSSSSVLLTAVSLFSVNKFNIVQGEYFPAFLFYIWNDRQDLQSTFDLSHISGTEQLINWWQINGKLDYPLLSCFDIEDYGDKVAPRYGIKKTSKIEKFGVNIVGFPQGVLGLGEDARMAAKVIELASIPCSLSNAPIAGPQRIDNSMAHLISEELNYPVTLFCLPPTEMMRLPLEGGLKLIESDTYKIGAWPWELPHWPTPFSRVRQFVDEIWAQSDYVKSCFSRNSDTPVVKMPMAVELPSVTANLRGQFSLPAEHFLFYLLFDGHSWLTRKNPLAGIQAFQKAFSFANKTVGLVIKAMNTLDSDPIWQKICQIAAKDARIHIISERLSRQDAVNLMASCDCYISLHRSEGFGRVIAEAMLLGQPVVVTNFSGNVDYCDQTTAFLVDGALVPLRAGDYLFHEGQYWCDPDVSLAAEQLQRVFHDVALRQQIGEAGKLRIISDYSIQSVAKAYADQLSKIAEHGLRS